MTHAPTHNPPAATGVVIPLHLILANTAKMLCSAVFVSGRDLEEAKRNSALQALFLHHMHDVLLELLEVEQDDAAREVTVGITLSEANVRHIVAGYRAYYAGVDAGAGFDADWDAESARLLSEGRVSRTARFLGDQGSTVVPLDGREMGFTPVPVATSLPAADTLAWPMGDLPPAGAPAPSEAFAAAVDKAFADDDAYTAGVIVVHKGEIVAERYRPGITRDTQLESWSMGKSLTATLIGVLIQKGLISLDDPAPIPEWQGEGDPRAEIRLRDVLQMSSGLKWTGQDSLRKDWTFGIPDHWYVYSEAIDGYEFAVNRPAEFPPGTVGRYHNCDPLTLNYIVKRLVTETLNEPYLTWPQKNLFDRIGIRKQVLETDWYGNFLLQGCDYGTVRNWARLGLLYLNDGVWDGERILPEGWSEFVGTPAPGWAEPKYGGMFWVNGVGDFALPENAYIMSGVGGQHVFVVPTDDLVIVRMGHRADQPAAREATNAMLAAVIDAVRA